MTFKYPSINYLFNIVVPIIFMVGILIWGILEAFNSGMTPLVNLIVVVVPILLISTTIGLSNPAKVEVTDKSITFYSFGLCHTYHWDELERLRLRRYDYIGKIYIGIGPTRILGGSYWISNNITGYAELNNLLYEKYQSIHVNKLVQENGSVK